MNAKSSLCFLWLALATLTARGQSTNAAPGPGSWGFDSKLARQILHEIAASQIHHLLWASIKWATLGALLGLALAIVAIILFRRAGWYRSEWKHAGWIRWPLWISTVIFCPLLLGTAGFWKGAIHGSERVLLKSQMATDVFPKAGDVVADGVAAIQVFLTDTNSATRSETNLTARVGAFRNGEWEVNAPAFVRQMDEISADAMAGFVAALEAKAVASHPRLQTGLGRTLLHQSLGGFGAALARKKLDSEMKRLGVADFYHALRDRLVVEARQHGDPDTINHRELSAFIVKEAIVPSLMKPIRTFAGGQAKLFVLLALLAAVLPPAGFRAACGRVKSAK